MDAKQKLETLKANFSRRKWPREFLPEILKFPPEQRQAEIDKLPEYAQGFVLDYIKDHEMKVDMLIRMVLNAKTREARNFCLLRVPVPVREYVKQRVEDEFRKRKP
jgi:hypothetical protein